MANNPAAKGRKATHLHLVGGPEPVSQVAGGPDASAATRPTGADSRARVLRSERELLAAVRGVQHRRYGPPAAPPARPKQSTESAAIATAAAGGRAPGTVEIASRMNAMAGQQSSDSEMSSADPDRLDLALAQLQARRPLILPPQLWPGRELVNLATVAPESAARWLLCVSAFLHRARPRTRLDVAVRGLGCLSLSASSTETEVGWTVRPRSRKRRDAIIRGSLTQIGKALADRPAAAWPLSGRRSVPVLAAVAALPLSLSDLRANPSCGIDPLAFWGLVAVTRPCAWGDQHATVVHRDPTRPDLTASVTVEPGRPIRVRAGEATDADAVVETCGRDLLHWALDAPLSGAGTGLLASGSGEAESTILLQVGRPGPSSDRVPKLS